MIFQGNCTWASRIMKISCLPLPDGRQSKANQHLSIIDHAQAMHYRIALMCNPACQHLRSAMRPSVMLCAIKSPDLCHQVTICNHAAKLRQLTMPMLLIAGWLDATAAPAISIFAHVARTPGLRPPYFNVSASIRDVCWQHCASEQPPTNAVLIVAVRSGIVLQWWRDSTCLDLCSMKEVVLCDDGWIHNRS